MKPITVYINAEDQNEHLEIRVLYDNGEEEVVDTSDDMEEAAKLCDEYRMAFNL